MNLKLLLIAAVFLPNLLSGCASSGGNKVNAETASIKVLRADGFSRFNEANQPGANRDWRMTQQAAKLDAYRNLASQLYTEQLDGNKTVGAQVMNNEAYRVYLDIYLREARAVDYRTAGNTLKTTLELDLKKRFYRCMSGDTATVNQCLQQAHKSTVTRLGVNTAKINTVNMACAAMDCGDQFYTQGFSKDRNPVDNVLLDAGLYDLEWDAHTGASLFARLFFFKELINGF